MNEGIFIAASGALKQERKMEVVANNLANVNNVGFKKDSLVFESMIPPFKSDHSFETSRNILLPASKSNLDVAYVGVSGFATNHDQGALERTDNVLDIGLDGDGLIAVETPAGTRYTRKGNFRLDAQGRLATQNGHLVIGDQGGPITIDVQGRDITIDINGNISVGNGLENVAQGKIKIVKFDADAALEKDGDGFFRLTDPKKTEQPSAAQVRQGFLEQSNVNSVEEMTRMIATLRAFEAYQKVIQAFDGIDNQAINNLGRVG
jgi:flagellar basal-body rod protein FlgG